jgi:hypothetical protein
VQFEKYTQLPSLPPIGTVITVFVDKGTQTEELVVFEVKHYEHNELSPGIWGNFTTVCNIADHMEDIYSGENEESEKLATKLIKNLKKNGWVQVPL